MTRGSPEEITLARLCRLGVPDRPPSFLLWGDSHADGLAPAFDMLAHEAGVAGLRATGSACNPLLADSGRGDCDQLNAAVRQVLAMAPVEIVVAPVPCPLAGATPMPEPTPLPVRGKPGPRTPEGKARSRMNALKHGLRAREFGLLPEEEPAEWAEHLGDLRAALGPADP